jgi:molybdenum cofactor synthesis domain-containing protein
MEHKPPLLAELRARSRQIVHRSAPIAGPSAARYLTQVVFPAPVFPRAIVTFGRRSAEPLMTEIVTAAMMVIGDEILSGRTKDRNIGHLADIMTAIGIDLKEVRIVPDEEGEIVAAVNALRGRYDYVFTTGGIGPTHDDITADAIAKAFGVPCEYDTKAYALLEASYAKRDMEFTEARKRMARMPRGSEHIDNPVSVAPGFRVGNVHVMAGVPSIFQAMLDNVVPTLKTGAKLLSATVHCPFGEGTIGGPLADIQKAHPDTIIGSYPKYLDGSFWTELVVRARTPEALEGGRAAVAALVDGLVAAQRAKL